MAEVKSEKNTLTSDEWKKIENTLIDVGDYVNLEIDGYQISIIIVPLNSLNRAYEIFVDKKFNLKWLIEDCEIRRKFCQPHKFSLLSASEKTEMKKKFKSKKTQKQILEKFSYYVYYNHWTSFRSMKSHFIKNCYSIKRQQN